MKLCIPLIGLIMLTSCANRAVQAKTEFVIGPQCHPSAVLTRCNFAVDPPACHHIVLKYDHGCGKINSK